MRTIRIIRLFGIVALATLAGCATNRLRIEEAGDVALKGRMVEARSRAFLAQVEAARYAANVELIAADPACYPPPVRGRMPPDLAGVRDPASPPAGWLCEALAAGEEGGLDLSPLRPALAPTIQLIDTLAEYSGEIAKILEAPRPDPAADFRGVVATATAAQGLIHALAPSVRAPGPDPRADALANFIAFVAELQRDANTVAQLRRLRDNSRIPITLVANLTEHLEAWETSRVATERQHIVLAEALLFAATAQGARLNSAQRRTFAEGYYQRVLAAADSGQAYRSVAAALAALRQAWDSYHELLQPNPRLTEGQRRRRAVIIRQRLTQGLELAAAMITAFRP